MYFSIQPFFHSKVCMIVLILQAILLILLFINSTQHQLGLEILQFHHMYPSKLLHLQLHKCVSIFNISKFDVKCSKWRLKIQAYI